MSWSALTLSEVKMWPSETITFWLSSKPIENRTESGGTYQRNQAFRLTTACGFFEMPWPSQMSIRTHHVILSVDVIWCLIGTDFVRRKKSVTCNWSIRTSFLRLLVGLFRKLNMSKKTCFAISASYLWNVFLTLGRMPVTTRRIVQFLHWHGILFLLSTDLPSFSSDDFPFPSLVAFEYGAGEDVRSFCLWSSLPLPEALTPWWKPHESPLEHCPVACHCQQAPTFLSTLALFSFRLLHESYRFGLWGSDFSSSGQKTISLMFLILNNLFVFLFRTVSGSYRANTVCNWTESFNFDFYNPSRTLSASGSSADNCAWYHLTSKILDIIILETYSE